MPDYSYSSAMKGADFVWDEEKLERFLRPRQRDLMPVLRRPVEPVPARRTQVRSLKEVCVGPEAAIEPDLRLALAKPRFRPPLQF